jgi:hypothetical protein
MIKFFRRIRQNLISENKFTKYLLYAIGEIILVVIGILIALSINNRNNQKILRQTELTVYENIKSQINEDRGLLEGVISYNNIYAEQYKFANEIIEENDRSKIDTLARIAPNIFKYSDINRSGNIFQNLINSGDLKLLTNHEIVESIQSLEELYIYMNRMEDIHFKVILEYAGSGIIDNINFINGQVERPDDIYSFKFQNLLFAFLDISDEKNDVYHRAVDQIDRISQIIDQELEE